MNPETISLLSHGAQPSETLTLCNPHACPTPQVSPTKLRGTLGTFNQLVICLGILSVLLVNVVRGLGVC